MAMERTRKTSGGLGNGDGSLLNMVQNVGMSNCT